MNEKDASDGDDDVYDSDVDDNVRRIDKMAADIDDFYSQKKEYMIERDRKLAKKEKKAKQLVEL
jgi:hypothetical protein